MKRLISLFLSVFTLLAMTNVALANNIPVEEEISSMSTLGVNMTIKSADNMISTEDGIWGNGVIVGQTVDELDSWVRDVVEWVPGFDQKVTGVMVGYNHPIGSFMNLGGFAGYTLAMQNFYEGSTGNIFIGTLGIQANANVMNWFDLGISVRGNYITQSVESYKTVGEDTFTIPVMNGKTFGFVGSVYLSKEIELGSNFVITPSASYTYYYTKPYNYEKEVADITVYEFELLPENGYSTYVGVSAGQNFGKFSYSVNVGWIYDSSNSAILESTYLGSTPSDARIDLDSNRHSIKVGAEVNYDLLSLKFTSTIGKQTVETFNIQLGLNYQF